MKSIFGIIAALLVDGALAATSGKFSILSMNVAGLPAILNQNDVPGDKTTNALSIGTKFAQYGFDVIHAQEVCLSLPVRRRDFDANARGSFSNSPHAPLRRCITRNNAFLFHDPVRPVC